MFLTEFFKIKKKCQHVSVMPNLEKSYCPDCGKLIKNDWYITRCACCGVKLKTMTRNGKILPQNHYCTNCGSSEFVEEKLEGINFIDINFAVLVKTEIEEDFSRPLTTMCWEEKINEPPKLLVQYL